MASTAMRVIRWFLGAVLSVLLLLLGLAAWGLYSFAQGQRTPHAPDVDKVARAPEVRAARQAAVGDVEAVYTTLEQTWGARAERRAEAVSDVCGSELRTSPFFGSGGGKWSNVRCEREVVRAYVLDGPREGHATGLADALNTGHWYRKGPHAATTPPCPAPAPATAAPSIPADHEPDCTIDATLPPRLSLSARFWDTGRSPYFSSLLRPADVRSTDSTTRPMDAQAVVNAPRPAGSSVVIVSVLSLSFEQHPHS
ncbi:hypothetical protein B4N89_30475 [Embleya scabrispora]|uniref:Uncharacterized protein n=1 Tax=Embleya scabrispora TaxID=159449 RepID=A0A1T3P6P7_9ACTN|nr:hypothetical protein [Embleya scabrispora]OPC84672.1 hypothetical protein B4N89_30475 [Embleya scabrispora]